MKRLILFVVLSATIIACVSCSETNVSNYSHDAISSETNDELISIVLSQDDVKGWNYYSEYTFALPQPSFEIESTIEVFVAGEMVLTFKSHDNSTVSDLLSYVDALEALGFENRVDFNSNELYYGKVYRDGVIAMEYTYRYGVILIDVFKPKYNTDTSIISEEEL